MEIGTKEFCDEIAAMLSAQGRGETRRGRGRANCSWVNAHVFQRRDEDITEGNDLIKSLISIMKRTIVRTRQNTWGRVQSSYAGLSYGGAGAHVFMLKVLEQLELTVCTFGEHRCAERLHDLLDGNILVGELIPGRAVVRNRSVFGCRDRRIGWTYQTRPKAPMPTGWRSEYLRKTSQ